MSKLKTVLYCLASLPPFLLGLLALSTFSPLSSGGLTVGLALGLALFGCAAFCWKVLRGGAPRPAAAYAVLLGTVLCVVLGTGALWRHRYEAFKKGCAAKGWPTSLADFREERGEADFAGPLLEKAYVRLGLESAKKELDAWSGPVLKPGESRPGGAWVRSCAGLESGAADPALGRPRLMPVDYGAAAADPINVPLPAMVPLITVGRCLRACASRAPDERRAWEQVARLQKLAALAASHRSTIGQAVACEFDAQAAKAALEVLARRPGAVLPEAAARALRERLRVNRLGEGLRSELAMSFDLTAWYRRGGSAGASRIGERVLSWVGFFEANGLAFGRMLAAFAAVQSREDSAGAAARVRSELEGLPGWPYVLARIAMPDFSRTFGREFEARTWCRLALAAGASARLRAARGRFPKDLSELGPDEALDETTGRPLVLRKPSGGGIELCGGDGKDSRGQDFCARLR